MKLIRTQKSKALKELHDFYAKQEKLNIIILLSVAKNACRGIKLKIDPYLSTVTNNGHLIWKYALIIATKNEEYIIIYFPHRNKANDPYDELRVCFTQRDFPIENFLNNFLKEWTIQSS